MPKKSAEPRRAPAATRTSPHTAADAATSSRSVKAQSGMVEKRLAALKERLAEVADLEAASAVLGWDQATYMPRGGVGARGAQSATLDRLAHEKFTDPEIGRLLDALQPVFETRGVDDLDTALIRVTRRDYDAARKIPEALVARISLHTNAAYTAWTDARPANDFTAVLPHLERGVALARALSEALGGGAHVMDPLIDRSEPGMTVASVTALFDGLRAPLVALVERAKSMQPGEDACLLQHYPEAEQLALGLRMAEHFGYDLTRGRQDISPHPFCTTFANGDVRITTRVKAHDLSDALYSTLHEAGHAMYEQGVAPALDRTRLQGGASPGVHESQSRLWENIVGRSEGFLTHAYPLLQKQFPKQLKRVPLKTFYRAINRVAPSLIRTDADELTYNLHVMIRFDLECRLLDGRLQAKDIPEAWAAAYARDLGVTVPNHSEGCLQDVHWFSYPIGGSFQGYTIGNILSAQFYAAAVARHPAIPTEIAAGKFATLHGWLRENIYRHGRMYAPADLVQRATGGPMSTEPYLAYLTAKYEALAEMRKSG
jgi:carboxypeptidase Taq